MTTNDARDAGNPHRAVRNRRPPAETEELREDIAHTRDELGATVEALAQKADVKARAKDKAAQLKGNVVGQARKTASRASTPAVRRGTAVAVAGAGAGAVAWWVRQRRGARKPTKWEPALRMGRRICGKATRKRR
ncbi:DUF3618 domain-containing protein [Actinomadura sp. HBU206391]|uniref:DUF3618 domain-containing protein n=1 Tax=Actinomadura sp. HBU206391 TaxID=2731692 RepID=UPI00164F81A0|nr:DUF3618 domain-containing protein [Actinomadura sp. HBU206391]MBC6462983.1 DUF3618 domain-containing protein [Actinomadura sp. HBU206391]